MLVAKKDSNGRNTMTCAASTDGVTIVPILVNPTNHGLKIMDATTGSDNGNNGGNAMIDENGVSVFTALSSTGDIVEIYGDISTGAILINSN